MADTLRIKRRSSAGAAGAPTSLAAAEIAYNEKDETLYYGWGNSSGSATSIKAIAGPGAFIAKSGDTMTGALIATDITITYPPSPTSGALRFGNAALAYIFWNGSSYSFYGGDVVCSHNVTAANYTASTGGSYIIGTANLFESSVQTCLYVNYTTNYYNYTKSTGRFDWVVNSASQLSLQLGGHMYVATKGYQPGGGTWADSSDIRIKNVIGEYKTGLSEVLQLRPVMYTFKGNDTSELPAYVETPEDKAKAPHDREPLAVPYPNSPHSAAAKDKTVFCGLIAQEAEEPMPEIVKRSAGYIDGQPVADLRYMDTTPLIYALINSIKELTARLDAVEAKL